MTILTPATPSAFFIPVTPQPQTPGRTAQRLENLTRCLNSSVPAEIVYPSFGQVYAEAETIGSFLDLYKKSSEDEARMRRVKSPTSRESEAMEWKALEDVMQPAQVIPIKAGKEPSRKLPVGPREMPGAKRGTKK